MTPLFGPGWGNYAIAGIVEIRLPEAVSLWPVTPGWWLLLALLASAAGERIWRRWRRYQRDRYRREAMSALETLRLRHASGDAGALRELAPLLRATALAAAPRDSVVSLSGDAWAAALHEMAPQLPPLPVGELHRLAYAPLSEGVSAAPLFDSLQQWIAKHRDAHA